MKFFHQNRHIIFGCLIAIIMAISASTFIASQYNDNESAKNRSKEIPSRQDGGTTDAVATFKVRPEDELGINLDTLFVFINIERTKLGLAPLARDPLLDKSAEDKCTHMVVNNYWAHTAPDGTEFSTFIKKYNKYNVAGENLAYGHDTVRALVTGWMKSPGHRENIVKTEYENVGYAKCKYYQTMTLLSNEILIVQHFSDNPFN